eukprot:8799553-Pyramimonas_sp.AAC.1
MQTDTRAFDSPPAVFRVIAEAFDSIIAPALLIYLSAMGLSPHPVSIRKLSAPRYAASLSAHPAAAVP